MQMGILWIGCALHCFKCHAVELDGCKSLVLFCLVRGCDVCNFARSRKCIELGADLSSKVRPNLALLDLTINKAVRDPTDQYIFEQRPLT